MGTLFDDDDILAGIHGFHGGSHARQTAADNADVRVIDLVAGRMIDSRTQLILLICPGLSRASTCRDTDRRRCASQHKPPARHVSQCPCRVSPVHNSPFVRLSRVDFRRGSTQVKAGYVTAMRDAPTYSSVRRRREFS